MSIDTLLEAARYLEWQAQQQQITRGKAGRGGLGDCIDLQDKLDMYELIWDLTQQIVFAYRHTSR